MKPKRARGNLDIQPRTIALINEEATRTQRLKAEGRFTKTCGEMHAADALLVVLEELGETAQEVLEGRRDFRTEAIETINCLVQAVQRPDKRGEKSEIPNARLICAQIVKLSMQARAALDGWEADQKAARAIEQRRA